MLDQSPIYLEMCTVTNTFIITQGNILDKCEKLCHQLGVFSQQEEHLAHFSEQGFLFEKLLAFLDDESCRYTLSHRRIIWI